MSTIHILIINPNTTQSMTESLKSSISAPSDVTVDYFTAPQSEGGIASINSPSDAHLSATHCLPHLLPLLDEDRYDGFLVACYSEHPLVGILATEIQAKKRKKQAHVIGIFEASVLTALGLLSSYPPSLKAKWGIVSTGKIWEEALSTGVTNFLGTQTTPTTFAGVETTGLSAVELHQTSAEEVKRRMASAARRLGEKGAKVVSLGCAGMTGLGDAIREGLDEGEAVRVVDGVLAGVQWLIGVARTGF